MPRNHRGSFYRFASPAIGLMALAVWSAAARADFIGQTRVADGIERAVFTAFAPGDPDRMFIADLSSPGGSDNATGTIRVLDLTTGALQASPYLTIPGIDNRGEGGLLGLAFHPDFQTNGKFYVNLTAGDSDPASAFSTYIREYTAPTASSPTANASFTTIMRYSQPQFTHNAGWLGFGPNDGYLYIMSGDGGGSYDNQAGHTPGIGNAQDVTDNLLGKVLRVDVNRDDFAADPERNYGIPYDILESPGGAVEVPGNPFAPNAPGEADPEGDNEIWAYGLRNPFRAGFDRATGDLWIGDVGQQSREEVNFQPGSSHGGENYGWRLREGSIETPGVGGPRPPGNVDPIWDYKRHTDPTGEPNFTGNTVLGGLPYRGPDPSLQGLYFFGDTGRGHLWTLRRNGDEVDVDYVNPELPFDVGVGRTPISVTEDSVGNLYITYINSGSVYRIETDEFTPGDFNGDAMVDGEDLEAWKANFGALTDATRSEGDADADNDVDGADFLAWQRNLGWSPLNVETPAGGASIPEPAASVMLIVGAIAAIGRSRRRK